MQVFLGCLCYFLLSLMSPAKCKNHLENKELFAFLVLDNELVGNSFIYRFYFKYLHSQKTSLRANWMPCWNKFCTTWRMIKPLGLFIFYMCTSEKAQHVFNFSGKMLISIPLFLWKIYQLTESLGSGVVEQGDITILLAKFQKKNSARCWQ